MFLILTVMRKTLNVNMYMVRLCLTLLVVSGCESGTQVEANKDLETFNAFIGESKTKVLDQVVISYEHFLETNYSGLEESEATTAFLADIRDQVAKTPSYWIIRTETNKAIVEEVESTGLRKEVWLTDTDHYDYKLEYGLEDDTGSSDYIIMEDIEEEIIPITEAGMDSSDLEKMRKKARETRYFHTYGKYLQGLKELKTADSTILGYIEAKESIGNISPSLIAGGLLKSTRKGGFTNPIIKRIVVIELYMGLIMNDVRINEAG